jgi:ubiquinone/menaquinone biosynthesis C-methylase UbiE
LPVADGTVDVIISNCVINLSPNKQRVFNEAFRVLKSGGRLMISDMVLLNELPDAVKESVQAYVGCISGAEIKSAYIRMIEKAGFKQVIILEETYLPLELMLSDATAKAMMKELDLTEKRAEELINSVISIKLSAIKPHT